MTRTCAQPLLAPVQELDLIQIDDTIRYWADRALVPQRFSSTAALGAEQQTSCAQDGRGLPRQDLEECSRVLVLLCLHVVVHF